MSTRSSLSPGPRQPSRRSIVRWAGALGAVGALPAGTPVWAQQGKFPDQVVKLIVALPAGGSVDIVARWRRPRS